MIRNDVMVEPEKNISTKGLISLLESIQDRYGYLPREELVELSESTGKRLVDIYGVATFFRAFSLEPRGKHLVSVCQGTACHVRNSTTVVEHFCKKLKVKPGKSTEDKNFSLETVNCLGACALGPVVVVDGKYYSNVTQSQVDDIITETLDENKDSNLGLDEKTFPVEVSCSKCNHSLMNGNKMIQGYPSIFTIITSNGEFGGLYLSSIYGSYLKETEVQIPENQVAQFYCPHCHAELIGTARCPECSIKMVPLILNGGGFLHICPRNGCKGHILDITGTRNL